MFQIFINPLKPSHNHFDCCLWKRNLLQELETLLSKFQKTMFQIFINPLIPPLTIILIAAYLLLLLYTTVADKCVSESFQEVWLSIGIRQIMIAFLMHHKNSWPCKVQEFGYFVLSPFVNVYLKYKISTISSLSEALFPFQTFLEY